MQRAIVAACLSAAFAVVLAAQAPAPQPPATGAGTSGSTAQGSHRGMHPMTVTGCLKAGETAGTYQLTNVEMTGAGHAGSATGETAGGVEGTTGEKGAGRMGGMRTVMLNPASNVKLAPHVGHKIEVTGTMTGGRHAGASGGTTSGGSTATAGSAGAGESSGMHAMNVTSMKMISSSCE